MSRATRVGLAVLAGGVLLGVLADLLLRETPLGLNAFLWIAAFAAVALAVARWQEGPSGGRRLLGVAVAFGALLVWRDSPWLAALNLAAAGVAVSLAVSRTEARAGVTRYAAACLETAWAAVAGAARTLFGEIAWSEIPRGRGSRQLAAAGRGFVLAVPLLAVFGGLFVAADAVFESLVRDLAPGDAATPVVHALVIGVYAWLATGLLRRTLASPDEPAPFGEPRPRRPTLGALELCVALGLVDLLFLAFVAVQIRYLFGGDERVASEAGLTYAEYARSGFFELVVVAALVLPLLLAGDWALRRERRADEWAFRALAAILLVLLLVVMASALQRMRLYQDAYGLTELRFYATAFMLWLAAVVTWSAATVLRGRREAFAVGALVAGFAAILATNAINPDAVIARTNLDRARSGAEIDLAYLRGLSDDAVPTLLDALPGLGADVSRPLAEDLLGRLDADDWRTWNVSRARADALLDERRADLAVYRSRAG